MAWQLGPDSTYRMYVVFKDGNVLYRYSYCWRHRYSKQKDPEKGLQGLRALVQKYGANAEVAVIYENKYGTKDGAVVERYAEGIKQ